MRVEDKQLKSFKNRLTRLITDFHKSGITNNKDYAQFTPDEKLLYRTFLYTKNAYQEIQKLDRDGSSE